MTTKRRFLLKGYNIPYDIYVVDTCEEAEKISGSSARCPLYGTPYTVLYPSAINDRKKQRLWMILIEESARKERLWNEQPATTMLWLASFEIAQLLDRKLGKELRVIRYDDRWANSIADRVYRSALKVVNWHRHNVKEGAEDKDDILILSAAGKRRKEKIQNAKD